MLFAVLLAAVCAFAMKDPLVVLARRRVEGKMEGRCWVAVEAVIAAVWKVWLLFALQAAAPVCYLLELRRQRSPCSLETPLTGIGLQSLALSLVFAGPVTFGIVSRR